MLNFLIFPDYQGIFSDLGDGHIWGMVDKQRFF